MADARRTWGAARRGCCAGANRRGIRLRRSFIFACLALAACGPYPRDVSGTLDRIEQTDQFRVGFAELSREDEQMASAFVERLEQATEAEAEIDTGSLERQLARLEEGELDIVVGEFAAETPWATPVTILEPLSTRRVGTRTLDLSPAARNGENRWIALLEREIRDARGT